MTMNSYKKAKKECKQNFKLLRQILISSALFLVICLVGKVSPEFNEFAANYTKKNTDFLNLYNIVSKRVEQCFEEIRMNVDIK